MEECIIENPSKQELFDIETICFEQDIVWCGSGRTHITLCRDETIKIDNEMSVVFWGNYPKLPHYTGKEFIDKSKKSKYRIKTQGESKYRIKTEKELIKEFGINWRDRSGPFVNSMDFLLGKRLTKEEEEKYLKFPNSFFYEWQITESIITKNKPKWVDKFIPTKVSLNNSLYRHKKVNLNQNR